MCYTEKKLYLHKTSCSCIIYILLFPLYKDLDGIYKLFLFYLPFQIHRYVDTLLVYLVSYFKWFFTYYYGYL